MSDTNTNPQDQAPAAPAQTTDAETTATTRDELPKQLFATRDEALAAKPANPPKNTRAFEIAIKGEVKGWILAIGYDPAISRAAQLDSYSASTGAKTAVPVTREAVAAKLATFSDAELAAMGLSRTAPATANTVPTPSAQMPAPAPTARRGAKK